MRSEPDCIFCKIVNGEIPSLKLYEDDRILSFMDINPFNDGHCLVVLKDHAETLFQAEVSDLERSMRVVQRVARAVDAALSPPGMNLVQANGAAAGQTVFHYHMHVFPRRDSDGASLNWGHNPGDMERIKSNHEKILSALTAEI